jgi:hypothetical protein
MRSTTPRTTGTLLRGRKALVVAGSAAALLGTGTAVANAATLAPAGHEHATVARHVKSPKRRSAGSVKPSALPMAHGQRVAPVPAFDKLRPVPVYGAQETMPISTSQFANAATIVKQALAKKMGLRSAVIAVATSMQESQLVNINYGTGDSLGLFQQQADCGWGTPQQIMNPAYAADAFLTALHKYQSANPDWASQPLWQSAQGVQASGFPTAYAKWEAQAASLVHAVTQSAR